MTIQPTLIHDLDSVITHGSAERRAAILMQVTDLFIEGSTRYSESEISLFDEIIARLVDGIESSVRAMLADRLAPIAKAPVNISRLLASDDEIRVAEPMLMFSERLDMPTLLAAARTKSQAHLLAISRRKFLSEEITDVLVERGNQEVALSAAQNLGAKFSKTGFSFLIDRSAEDDLLGTCVGSRPDISRELFLRLLSVASNLVRTKLINQHPNFATDIDHAVTAVVGNIRNGIETAQIDYAAVESRLRSMQSSGELTDPVIGKFAEQGRREDVIAAIAIVSNAPIQVVAQTIDNDETETLLILAKAAQLSWKTTKLVIGMRPRRSSTSVRDLERNMASFERLNFNTARQIVEFYRRRGPGVAPSQKEAKHAYQRGHDSLTRNLAYLHSRPKQ